MHANRRAFCTQKYIGFFDSGIGGLTLLAECVRRMPEERFIYLGDNDRAPYGNRPRREIKKFVFQGFSLLSAYPLKGGVIACNTATAVAAEALRETVPFPVLGVEPAVRPALLSGAERVLVLATRATVSSPRFAALCARCGGRILAYAPEHLARAIEEHIFTQAEIDLRRHLPRLRCDAVVLGCTHYIFLRREIAAFYGCRTYDGNEGTAKRLASVVRAGSGRGADFGRADHFAKNTNICSKIDKKTLKNSVIFLGSAKNKNKKVFLSLF